jgi:hypothetical protein
MLKQLKFTIDCVISIHDIQRQDAERAYRDDPNVGCYLEEPDMLEKIIDQQRRLLHAILNREEILRKLARRYAYEYIRDRLYDDLPKPPEVSEEMFLVIGGAIDTLDFVDRALYLAYAAPGPEYEEPEDGDPFEQHTRLIKNSFYIKLRNADLTDMEDGAE